MRSIRLARVARLESGSDKLEKSGRVGLENTALKDYNGFYFLWSILVRGLSVCTSAFFQSPRCNTCTWVISHMPMDAIGLIGETVFDRL